MSELPEYRRPWWHRWAGLLGEPRRRWRGMDERERFQAGIVLRAVLLAVLVYATSWPLALLVLAIIVVGYAGLLDLGYVAFYAMGAYTCAWFASVQFAKHHVQFGAVGVSSTTPGIHISVWLLVLLAGILTAIIGIVIGLPTLRLRG